MQLQKQIKQYDFIPVLFGTLDRNKKWLEKEGEVQIHNKNDLLIIEGEELHVQRMDKVLTILEARYEKDQRLDEQQIRYAMEQGMREMDPKLQQMLDEVLVVSNSGRSIKPKTIGQAAYIDAIRNHDIVFGIGPAGTGKTYLAMAMAADAYKKKQIERIILTRPAVEAGENLGFLPGDLQEKIDPYLRPLYDALFDILGFDTFTKLKEKGLIEVAPLAYMRGRTLDHAFIILDEAQNTTNEQMKMFLTRMGYGSKAIVTGDITQIDLPKGRQSGLVTVNRILRNVKGIAFTQFHSSDVVRHPLVQRIILAYEQHETEKEKRKENKK